MATSILSLALLLLPAAEPEKPQNKPPESETPPIKLEAVKRSGYALVTATGAADEKKALKQVEWIAVASGTPAEITYDQAGPVLVVTLPPSGTVTVFAIALLADGTLLPAVTLEVAADNPSPTPSPNSPATALAGEQSLRVSLVINQAAPGKGEQDLVLASSPTAQWLKQALAKLGHTWIVADMNSPSFQQALERARKTAPGMPSTAPFLFVETKDRQFKAAYKLQLQADARKNAEAILGLFGWKPPS